MSRRPGLIAATIATGLFSVHATAEPSAEDDAAFAVRVFAEQIVESERLAERGVVTKAQIENLRIQLTDAKIQHAIAQGQPQKRLVELLSERIALSESRLARVERLAGRGIVPKTELETARHDHRETLISLAVEVGDRREVIRLLKKQITATANQIEKSTRLSNRRVLPRASLAQEYLHLATLKNRLAAAEQELLAAPQQGKAPPPSVL